MDRDSNSGNSNKYGNPLSVFPLKKSLISQTENRHHPQITTQNRTQLKIEPKGQYHSPITVL